MLQLILERIPKHLAIGLAKYLQALIKNVASPDTDQPTLLQYSIFFGFKHIVKALLKATKHVNIDIEPKPQQILSVRMDPLVAKIQSIEAKGNDPQKTKQLLKKYQDIIMTYFAYFLKKYLCIF